MSLSDFLNDIEAYDAAIDLLAQFINEQTESLEEFARLLQELNDQPCEKAEIRSAFALHAIAHTQHHRQQMTARIIPYITFSCRWYTAATGT